MVKVFLRGGLGNQMFQYAAGFALAKANNDTLALDSVFLNDRFPRREFTYRTFDLDIFQLDPNLTAFSRLSAAMPLPGVWLGLDLALMRARAAVGMQRIVKEKVDHVFDPAFFDEKGNSILWGRWQNERYFKNSEADLRKAFLFRAPLTGEAKEIADQIAASHSVSLHVRRGDFGAVKTVIALMGETDLSYYERAAEEIAKSVKDPHFYVISDDVAWCQAHLKLNFPMTFVPSDAAGPKGAFHLELMSRCKHNIIANSTFSWWGAWLNANPDKIVISPRRWYADRNVDRENILPKEWITL